MSFEKGNRSGRIWDDVLNLEEFIKKFDFNITGKKERDFENAFSAALKSHNTSFNEIIYTQMSKDSKVESVYCFGKKHRPDLAMGIVDKRVNGIAVEIKLVKYSGLKNAIGQGYVYRLRYKFVFLILILTENKKDVYEKLSNNDEKDMHDVLTHLSESMNIFSYIVPAFKVKPGIKKCISFFV